MGLGYGGGPPLVAGVHGWRVPRPFEARSPMLGGRGLRGRDFPRTGSSWVVGRGRGSRILVRQHTGAFQPLLHILTNCHTVACCNLSELKIPSRDICDTEIDFSINQR